MSRLNSKNKGSRFEAEAVKVLNSKIKKSDWQRIPMSGSIGTRIGIPTLSSDVIGTIESFSKTFRVECKVGYNNSDNKEVKQMTIKKEWLDKVNQEAKNTYSIPMVFCKMDNVREGIKYFTILDVDTFALLINEITDLKEELDLAYERLENGTKND